MVLTLTKEMSDFFEATVANGAEAKQASNWLMGEVSAYLNAEQQELHDTALTPENLAGLIKLIEAGTISSKIAKKVFRDVITEGGNPEEIVKAKGLVQMSDAGELTKIITEIIDNNLQSVEDFKNGKDRAVGFLVGQAMKVTKGQANPKMVNQIIVDELNRR